MELYSSMKDLQKHLGHQELTLSQGSKKQTNPPKPPKTNLQFPLANETASQHLNFALTADHLDNTGFAFSGEAQGGWVGDYCLFSKHNT